MQSHSQVRICLLDLNIIHVYNIHAMNNAACSANSSEPVSVWHLSTLSTLPTLHVLRWNRLLFDAESRGGPSMRLPTMNCSIRDLCFFYGVRFDRNRCSAGWWLACWKLFFQSSLVVNQAPAPNWKTSALTPELLSSWFVSCVSM